MTASRILLTLPDPWEQTATRPLKFEGTVEASEVLTLEHLRELGALRAAVTQRPPAAAGAGALGEQLPLWERYLALLGVYAQEGGMPISTTGSRARELRVEWNSPLAGQPRNFFRLHGVQAEQAQAHIMYAAALRQQAYLAADELTDAAAAAAAAAARQLEEDGADSSASSTPDESGPQFAAAAGKLRTVAGLMDWVRETLLVPMKDHLPADRPAEVLPSMAEVMRQAALAEAQALTAARAEARRSPAQLTAALHLGVSELYEQAAATLKSATGDFNQVSEVLRRLLAVGSALGEARARRASAQHHAQQHNPGQGVADIQEARRLLQNAASVAADGGAPQRWRDVLAGEGRALDRLAEVVEREREVVYFQPVAKAPSPLPAAKVIVTPLAYVPPQPSWNPFS